MGLPGTRVDAALRRTTKLRDRAAARSRTAAMDYQYARRPGSGKRDLDACACARRAADAGGGGFLRAWARDGPKTRSGPLLQRTLRSTVRRRYPDDGRATV